MLNIASYKDRAFAGEADLQPVCDLLNLCDSFENLDDNFSVEDLRLEFDHPRLDKARDLRLWEDQAGGLAGFGQIWLREDTENNKLDGYIYFRVHPEARESALADDILNWISERLRAEAAKRGLPAMLQGFVRDYEKFSRDCLKRHGYELVRYFFRMVRPLDQPIPQPEYPAGYKLRHVENDTDVAAWVDAYNHSFIDHWGFHPHEFDEHKYSLQSSYYRPEHDLVLEAPEGGFAAFCFCNINPGENERSGRNEGWIQTLGTRRGYRKLGLGRAMLLAGLHRLKASGADTAALGVDAENPSGALKLYESAGFQVTMTSVAYRKFL